MYGIGDAKGNVPLISLSLWNRLLLLFPFPFVDVSGEPDDAKNDPTFTVPKDAFSQSKSSVFEGRRTRSSSQQSSQKAISTLFVADTPAKAEPVSSTNPYRRDSAAISSDLEDISTVGEVKDPDSQGLLRGGTLVVCPMSMLSQWYSIKYKHICDTLCVL